MNESNESNEYHHMFTKTQSKALLVFNQLSTEEASMSSLNGKDQSMVVSTPTISLDAHMNSMIALRTNEACDDYQQTLQATPP